MAGSNRVWTPQGFDAWSRERLLEKQYHELIAALPSTTVLRQIDWLASLVGDDTELSPSEFINMSIEQRIPFLERTLEAFQKRSDNTPLATFEDPVMQSEQSQGDCLRSAIEHDAKSRNGLSLKFVSEILKAADLQVSLVDMCELLYKGKRDDYEKSCLAIMDRYNSSLRKSTYHFRRENGFVVVVSGPYRPRRKGKTKSRR